MSKKYSCLVTIIFIIFLVGMLLFSVLEPDVTFSEMENRNLQPAPELRYDHIADGKFMKDAEAYVSDHIAFRDQWVALKALSERISGKKENNGIYFGKDGTLIKHVNTPDEKKITENLHYINGFAEKSGIPVYLGIIPTAASVWRDKLPQGAPTADEQAWIQDIYANTSAKVIPLYDALFPHKDEALYYHTDHHWTSLGAFYGANAILDAMGMEMLNLNDYTRTTVSSSFYGTSFSSSGAWWVKPDAIDTYIPDDGIEVVSNFTGAEEPGQLYVPSYLEAKNKYAYFLGGNQPLCVIKSQAVGPKILILRDSYSDSLAPFLTQRFSEVHLFDLRYNRSGIQDYIAENGIDQVLILYNFSNFIEETNLFRLN